MLSLSRYIPFISTSTANSAFCPGSGLFSPRTQFSQGPRQHSHLSQWLPERSPGACTLPNRAVYSACNTQGGHGAALPLLHPSHSAHLGVKAVVLTRARKSCRTQSTFSSSSLVAPFPLSAPAPLFLTHAQPAPAPDLCSSSSSTDSLPRSLPLHSPLPSGPAQTSPQERSLTTPHETVMVPLSHTSCSSALLFPGACTVRAKSPQSCLTL